MRDPNRIPSILTKIEAVWKRHPDMRLGQLLVNLLDPSPNRLFYVEDDVLAKRLADFIETGVWPTRKQSNASGDPPPS